MQRDGEHPPAQSGARQRRASERVLAQLRPGQRVRRGSAACEDSGESETSRRPARVSKSTDAACSRVWSRQAPPWLSSAASVPCSGASPLPNTPIPALFPCALCTRRQPDRGAHSAPSGVAAEVSAPAKLQEVTPAGNEIAARQTVASEPGELGEDRVAALSA